MSLDLVKLQHLWRTRSALFKNSDYNHIESRAEEIFTIAERWEQDRSRILAIESYGRPDDSGIDIPHDSWSTVKHRQHNLYSRTAALAPFSAQIEEVSSFLHLQNRNPDFRLSSDADFDSPWETPASSVARKNPESRFASYNFPFEIVQFLLNCGVNPQGFSPPPFHRENRFILKFVWMVANRENVIPILSLRSFRALARVFRSLHKEPFEWGDQTYRWTLSLKDFTKVWPSVSGQLCLSVTGTNYAALSPDDKLALTTLLFIASISDTSVKNAFDMVRTGNQAIIFYGPPGTGKTHHARLVAKELLAPKLRRNEENSSVASSAKADDGFDAWRFSHVFPESEASQGPEATPKSGLTHGCWEIVQFHPSYSYHDFIGGIVPNLKGTDLTYREREGVFKRLCDVARENPDCPFVLIIDEINRANLSSVFGELMYALEYRNSPVNTLQFGPFSIPRNVYLIGTMNTADKSLQTFDLALRRRFLFMKLMPDLGTLEEWNGMAQPHEAINGDDLSDFITSAEELNLSLVNNQRGGLDLPADFQIGQAYFMKIRDFCVLGDNGQLQITQFAREQLWDYHIEPLLEEYLGSDFANRMDDIKELRKRFTKRES